LAHDRHLQEQRQRERPESPDREPGQQGHAAADDQPGVEHQPGVELQVSAAARIEQAAGAWPGQLEDDLLSPQAVVPRPGQQFALEDGEQRVEQDAAQAHDAAAADVRGPGWRVRPLPQHP
jgi:hypothetical protein